MRRPASRCATSGGPATETRPSSGCRRRTRFMSGLQDTVCSGIGRRRRQFIRLNGRQFCLLNHRFLQRKPCRHLEPPRCRRRAEPSQEPPRLNEDSRQ